MLIKKELRKDTEDNIDDVVVEDVRLFRMESMDRKPDGTISWWIRVSCNNKQDLVIRFESTNQPSFEIED